MKKKLLAGWWGLTAAAFAGAIALLALYTPTEQTMGQIQKVFYIHLPVAINTFLACLVCFVASIGYLAQRRMSWDDLAASAAKVAVVLCTIVLITGMIWAKGAWGRWWTWSPRLTFSLMLWLLYVVYLIIRNSVDSAQRRAVIGAVYAVIAFLDVPLVYLSSRLMPDIHPQSIELESAMKVTLAVWFVPVTLAAAAMIVGRYMLARQEVARDDGARGFDVVPTANPANAPAWAELLKKPESTSSAEVAHD